MTAPRALLTAFEPFGGRRVNRSSQVVERVRAPDGVVLEREVLPVDFARLPGAVAGLLARRPDVLVMVGEASRTRHMAVERVGLNVIHARLADNSGRQPSLEPVREGGVLALTATWDAARVAQTVQRAGVPARVSHHAGTYACNAALYLALDGLVRDGGPTIPIGFLHVPTWPWPLAPSTESLASAVTDVLSILTREVRRDN